MIYARITSQWTHKPHETHFFYNIADCDVSFYDNLFWSRPGYADFTLTFAYDPILKNPNLTDSITKFSKWWKAFDKNYIPRIIVEFYDGTNAEAIAKGYLFDWEEDREEREIVFTCIDELKDILDEQVSRTAFTKNSPDIIAVKQPTGPDEPPGGGDDLPPINPPGTPTISYMRELTDFFWDAVNEWWNSFRGSAPTFVKPPTMPPPLPTPMVFSCFALDINERLQQLSSGTFRVQIKFKALSNIERKEVLSDISKYVRAKLVCKNGIRFIYDNTYTNVKGFVQSVNSNNTTAEIDPDRIIDSILLQQLQTDSEGNTWWQSTNYTAPIKQKRDIWLRSQIRPRTEYNIWGYAENINNFAGVLQSGYSIRLGSELFKIKEISYESETMHTIKSFEAVCIKPS